MFTRGKLITWVPGVPAGVNGVTKAGTGNSAVDECRTNCVVKEKVFWEVPFHAVIMLMGFQSLLKMSQKPRLGNTCLCMCTVSLNFCEGLCILLDIDLVKSRGIE